MKHLNKKIVCIAVFLVVLVVVVLALLLPQLNRPEQFDMLEDRLALFAADHH